MYNSSLKTKFIQAYTNNIAIADKCKVVFNATEKYEYKYDKDICTMNKELLQPIVNQEFVVLRHHGEWVKFNILKEYVKWCMRNHIPDVCDVALNIQIDSVDKLRKQTVSSPAHLEHLLNQIFDPAEEKTAGNIYRCYFWMAYAGLKEDDIFKVVKKDIDFANMRIIYNDIEYPIYREAVLAFKNCIELESFVYKHPNYSPDVSIYKLRASGQEIMRGVGTIPSVKSVRVYISKTIRLKKENNAIDTNLSYYRVWLSGLFFRTHEKEMMGIEPDFQDFVNIQTKGKVYKLDSGRGTQKAKKRQLALEYLDDYQRWKLAYKI